MSVTVKNCDGRVLSTFNFERLSIDRIISSAMARAFVALYGHTSLETQRQSWRCVRKFVQCADEMGIGSQRPLSSEALVDFQNWLFRQALSDSTRQSQFNVVLALLSWCSRNYPEAVSRKLRTSVTAFKRDAPATRRFLEADSVKILLKACYSDIEKIEEKLKLGKQLTVQNPPKDENYDLAVLVQQLLKLGDGRIPTQAKIHRSKNAFARRVVEAGGLRYINSLLMLSPTDMFPFFLAILIQTSGNPMAIRELRRDCVRPHPVREDLEVLFWDKPRSKKEQRVDFPKGRHWSAASLVRRLANINEQLTPMAEPGSSTSLFLAHAARVVRVPCIQMLHHLLSDFVRRHAINFAFDFKDLRRAGAKAHQTASSSLKLAQKRLNHASVKTTARYIDQVVLDEEHDRMIVRFQGELVSRALATESESPPNGVAEDLSDVSAWVDTVFGFQCKNPYAGTAVGSRRGEFCEQFHRCATCPGALIILDDPRVVARLVRTYNELSAARERAHLEGWWPRYEKYYLPTLRILESELLPAVSSSVLVAAEELKISAPTIRLE